jgi:outer membrane lipoprotein-sorting protein
MNRVLMAVAVAAAALAAFAEDRDPLADVFAKVDARAEEVKNLTADFRQVKKMKVRKRPIETTGRIHVKKTEGGPRVCWESWGTDPDSGAKLDPQRMLILGDEKLMWTYYLDENAAERTDLGKGRFEVTEVITIGGSLSGLKNSFEVSLAASPENGRGWRLALKPVSERLKRFVKALELEIHPEQWVVSRLELTDSSDTVTTIELSGFRMNSGVDEKAFEIPKDAKVTDVEFK